MSSSAPQRLVLVLLCFVFTFCKEKDTHLRVEGLQQQVEVLRDSVGVNHIYALNEHDLFFAQGYCAAKDRLFQFEMWRRQASGTAAEVFGEKELRRDIGARLFQYRGDWQKEFSHYHPRGKEILTAFTDGINAYVAETEQDPSLLPVEFGLLGIRAGRWKPEWVVSRHQGLLGNLTEEVNHGRAVARLGEAMIKELRVFEPGTPRLKLDDAIDKEGLFQDVIGLYEAFRKPMNFTPDYLVQSVNPDKQDYAIRASRDREAYDQMVNMELRTIGSNNWIVSPQKSESGMAMLANDPHRALSIPSLRYMVHLQAPGWNVVGGGEPTIPGVSIGHNEFGAWGLTIFDIDGEDLMVYDLNPANHQQYRYKNEWENMTEVQDTIIVKGKGKHHVTHRYTRHGPVTFIDDKKHKAYAVRAAWLEPGGAPYLASLRICSATTWEEFREACSFSNLPGENMIWADKKGNIGWQTVGIAPIRKEWDGLVPIPGDGRFEWEGYLPIKELPHIFNPEKGFWATANENLIPKDYAHRYAVGWEWADSSRANRINEVLGTNEKLSLEQMKQLQVDYYAKPASRLVPLLKNISFADEQLEAIKQDLLKWNYIMNATSVQAAVYAAWEKKISDNAYPLFVPEKGREIVKSIALKRTIDFVLQDHPALKGRNQFLKAAFQEAVQDLKRKLSDDQTKWQYGQPAYHHVLIRHPLSNAVTDSLRNILDCGPSPRGGNGSTPGMTGSGDNQTHGATFRMVVDLVDWDKAMFTLAPGQSGDPRSVFYRNLFGNWANDKHFPVYFSKAKIERHKFERVFLIP